MNNRVTFATYKLFQTRGYATMRFNFRGVGRSQGTFEQGDGELADAATAMDWLQAQFPSSNVCWIAGFSALVNHSRVNSLVYGDTVYEIID